MARSTTAAEPLKILREQATALEASILECLAKPTKRPVHKLRTSTRRIEAQLQLLSMFPELPPHEKPRQKVLKLLKKVRQTAGVIRDIDVQQELLEKAAPKKRSSQSATDVRRDARHLERDLKDWRDEHADKLIELLKQVKVDLPLALKQLFDSLGDADRLAIGETDLTLLVRNWYGQNTPVAAPDLDDIEHLHDIRKQAKLARYLAESAPASALKAHHLAAEFEDLQEAGGQWHDWLLLAEIARRSLGNSAELPKRLAARAEKSLKQFERQIERMNAQNPQPHSEAA
ncbi:MAG TPA: CHAD domain-containing protein [Acidobacteriaceae bacterium]|nr:CHAD domain-containing protein [Acidobacteriaceae bacterium]